MINELIDQKEVEKWEKLEKALEENDRETIVEIITPMLKEMIELAKVDPDFNEELGKFFLMLYAPET